MGHATDERRYPVIPGARPVCERGGCRALATWAFRDLADDKTQVVTHVCDLHVGEMMEPTVNMVWPIALEPKDVHP